MPKRFVVPGAEKGRGWVGVVVVTVAPEIIVMLFCVLTVLVVIGVYVCDRTTHN